MPNCTATRTRRWSEIRRLMLALITPDGEEKKNGSREGLRLPSASPLLGIEASGKFTEEQGCRFSDCVANHGASSLLLRSSLRLILV